MALQSIISVVIPVYNEEPAIPALVERLRQVPGSLAPAITEIILVDDHSTDRSPELLKEVCHRLPGFRYVRLAKNSGSHVAILVGLARASGDGAVFLAADLQDPPELIGQMLDLWRAGHQIVWAVRGDREGTSSVDLFLSNTFYRLLNLLGDISLPPNGSDFAFMDRKVIDALLASAGSNPSLGGDIARLGFCQTRIEYTKKKRVAGHSKWTLERKLRAFADAFVSLSYAPLRAMSYLGMLCSLFGFAYAAVVIVLRLISRNPIEGWSSLMVVVLVMGGVQMLMMGILGEYLWRTLEAARRRPSSFVEETVGWESPAEAHATEPETQSARRDFAS